MIGKQILVLVVLKDSLIIVIPAIKFNVSAVLKSIILMRIVGSVLEELSANSLIMKQTYVSNVKRGLT